MQILFKQTIALFLLLLVVDLSAQTTVNYQAHPGDFPNPERGFYRYSETRTSNYNPLDQATLENYRQPQTPFNANYSVSSTMIFRYFILDNYVGGPISAASLAQIANDFAVARAAGVKLLPRFTYTVTTSGAGCDGDICPPYGDAPKSVVLNHINQLQPVLQDNADVIAALQMGFIGVWGENYYTDHFGDASQPPNYRLSNLNWQDRNEVVAALLSALPNRRMLQVRYPQLKQRYVYGVNAPTNVAPLTAAEAYQETDKSRLGLHNDCLLASFTDFGTYSDYGNDNSSSMDDTLNLKPYFAADSRYVIVGGETCFDGYNPQNNCASSNPAAFGDTELERMHYSYLNADFNQDVNNDWQTDGCMDDIKRRLGYRFELTTGTFSAAGRPGGTVDFNLGIRNVGFAAPFNPRRVEVILRNTVTNEVHYAYVADEPRNWEPASIANLSHTLCLPASLPTGTYNWLFALPDPEVSLEDDPDYSIRIASLLNNNEIWEATTGYHDLGASLVVSTNGPGGNCDGEVIFTSNASPLPVRWLGFSVSRATNEVAKLVWNTAAERDNAGFGVERSLNGEQFSEIGWVAAASVEEELPTYTFNDPSAAVGQVYFYRLRQEDLDGSTQYSVIRRLGAGYSKTGEVVFYPNPANGQLLIDHSEPLEEIQVLDASGKVVIQTQGDVDFLDLTSLSAGVYFVRYRLAGVWSVSRVIRR